MTPAQCDIVVYSGCIVREAFEILNDDGTPYDLTGWSGAAQVRAKVGGNLIAEFIVDIDTDEALIVLEMDIEVSNAMPVGRFVWDLLISQVSGEPDRFMVGSFTKEGTVTEL